MGIRISKLFDEANNTTVLRIEGVVDASGVNLLEQACADLRNQSAYGIVLDLNGVTFIDSQSACAIRRLKKIGGIVLTGCQLFNHEVIEGSDAT
jgi:anti-anti-sigma factor